MSTTLPVIPTVTATPTGAGAPVHAYGHGLPIDPRAYERGLSCVHCGLCLPACPTYTENGLEADSPRGRIQLMLGLADGKIEPTESVVKHLDLCLDCRGCETACPSGVVYHELIEETRARLAHLPGRKLSLQDRFMRWVFYNVFVYPTRLKLVLLPARLLQKIGVYGLLRKVGLFKVLPSQLRKMEQMLPPTGALWPKPLQEHSVAGGTDAMLKILHHKTADITPDPLKETVGFFAGCIGSVMFEKVNRQAVELLAAAGADVLAPRAQVCCGAIHHHNGAHEPAVAFAKRNIDAFLPKDGLQVDHIATNIAGCGAMLREYDVLLRDAPEYAERAKTFAGKVRDISEVLLALGLPPMRHPVNVVATYHDACHLAHAQKVTGAPREMLAKLPGLKKNPLP
ncbi:MAG: heterodisulfide reductase-related iron-sulfur binding cluster, partial [Tepidisphaeraceae bacterium]